MACGSERRWAMVEGASTSLPTGEATGQTKHHTQPWKPWNGALSTLPLCRPCSGPCPFPLPPGKASLPFPPPCHPEPELARP